MAKVGLNLGLNSTVKNHKKKKGSYFRNYLIQRAENGTRTRDPQLGRLVLYFGNEKLRFPLLRLSYHRFTLT